MSTEYYCRGCKQLVVSKAVGTLGNRLRHTRAWGGCGFLVECRTRKEDMNQHFVSPTGKALEESRREVERLQLENVELRQCLTAAGFNIALLVKPACNNCGHPAHGDFILDRPEVTSGG
jgi:hypothetical protein